MKDSLQLTRKMFLECNWSYDLSPEEHYGYSSVMAGLQKSAKKLIEAGKEQHSKVHTGLQKG